MPIAPPPTRRFRPGPAGIGRGATAAPAANSIGAQVTTASDKLTGRSNERGGGRVVLRRGGARVVCRFFFFFFFFFVTYIRFEWGGRKRRWRRRGGGFWVGAPPAPRGFGCARRTRWAVCLDLNLRARRAHSTAPVRPEQKWPSGGGVGRRHATRTLFCFSRVLVSVHASSESSRRPAASALFCFSRVLVSVHASSESSRRPGAEPGHGWITRRSCRVRLRRMKFR
jgi:hypothetical protein